MIIQPETATIDIDFEPADLLKEIVIEIANEGNGPTVIAQAILDGIEQLDAYEQVEILDEIVGVLFGAADEMRDGEDT